MSRDSKLMKEENTMINGEKLRRELLGLRNDLDEHEITSKSKLITDHLLQLSEIREASNIFIYVSFRSEVQTFTAIEQLMELSKNVSVPVTHVKEKRLDAIEITDLSKDLRPGYCGIPEPYGDICTTKLIKPENIDVVILPGSVFDERGGRFGYGGGYYDRFLEKIPNATRIGLAFELQTVEKAPIKAHDELLDFIITEKRIIKGKR